MLGRDMRGKGESAACTNTHFFLGEVLLATPLALALELPGALCCLQTAHILHNVDNSRRKGEDGTVGRQLTCVHMRHCPSRSEQGMGRVGGGVTEKS